MTEEQTAALVEACREELQFLWGDLSEAIRHAINCTWSIHALNLKDRIQTLTRLVGPTPWEDISIDLLEQGIYQQVHAEIGVPVEVDMARVAQTRASIEARLSRIWAGHRA